MVLPVTPIAINGAVLNRRVSGSARVLRLVERLLQDSIDFSCQVYKWPRLYSTSRLARLVQWLVWDFLWFPFVARRAKVLVCPTNVAPAVRFRSRQRVIVFIHDVMVLEREEFDPAYRAISQLTFRWSALKADLIITPSQFSRNRILEVLRPSCPVEVIPYAVERNWFAGPHLRPPEPQFLTIGALEPHKRVPMAVEFARCVAERLDQRVHLDIVGVQGRDEARVIAAAEHAKRAGRIDYTRHEKIPDSALRSLLQSATCLLQFSAEEGFGFPVIEAAAVGTPAITSTGGSLSEFDLGVRHAWDDPLSADTIAYACGLATSDEQYREASASVFQSALASYSESAFATRFLSTL